MQNQTSSIHICILDMDGLAACISRFFWLRFPCIEQQNTRLHAHTLHSTKMAAGIQQCVCNCDCFEDMFCRRNYQRMRRNQRTIEFVLLAGSEGIETSPMYL